MTAGPYYGDILLSRTELRDILALQKQYRKFLLVLNVGGPVDLSPLGEVENILILSQLGMDTGNVLADLITGKACPSGKLTTTWSAFEDYAAMGDFGEENDTAKTKKEPVRTSSLDRMCFLPVQTYICLPRRAAHYAPPKGFALFGLE